MTTDGKDENRHSGFYVATPENNPDVNGILHHGKAWGVFANGTGFEQAVAYRAFSAPLAVGDSFSLMVESGGFEKKFETDDPSGGSVGLTLRTSNATDSPADYNKDAVFEFGSYQGKPNYQVYDGTGEDKTGTGVACNDGDVTVTITGEDSYDLEIQTMSDKNVTSCRGES